MAKANKLTDAQIKLKLARAKGWKRADVGGKPGIARTFPRSNFLDGLAFVTKVAVLAEKANHHPDVLLKWPCVAMSLTTHDAGGLTDKDFALAAEIDKVAQ